MLLSIFLCSPVAQSVERVAVIEDMSQKEDRRSYASRREYLVNAVQKRRWQIR